MLGQEDKMLICLTTSLELGLELSKSAVLDYNPQPLSIQKSNEEKPGLSRHATNVSELSKIITAIKDDHQLDNEEFESYKDRFPEQMLMEQLEISSRYGEPEPDSEDATEEVKDDHPIDGIFAFWQAFLVMLQIFSTWGVNAAFGVFLNYYLDSNSFPGASMYDYALMGGVIVFLAQFLAPLSVLLVKLFGQTQILTVGIIIQTLGYLLASICTEFWQVFICEGVMVGLSFTMIFIPGTLILPTWFDKRKSAAMGLAVAGAGLGGVVFSLALNKVIQDTGDQKWALRMTGILTFAVSTFATTFLRPRNKHKMQKIKYRDTLTKLNLMMCLKTIFDLSAFRSYHFVLLALWFGLVVMAYVIVLYSYTTYATSIGLSRDQASNLLAILNAAQVIGRPSMGQIGDACGRYNTAAFFCAYVGILIFAFWMNATTYAELLVLAIMVGGPLGVGSTMTQSLALDSLELIGKAEKLPAVWTTLNIVVGLFSLPSEVIGLSLKTTGRSNNYAYAQTYAGVCYLAGLLIMLVNREWAVRHVFIKRRKQTVDALSTNESAYQDTEHDCEKEETVEYEDCEILQARIERYNRLLGNTPLMFFVRMLYPIRI